MAKHKCKCEGGGHGGGGGHDTAGGMRWLVSYADMLTLLLALFIILWALKQDNPSRIIEMSRGLRIGAGTENPASPTQGKGQDETVAMESSSVSYEALYKEVSTISAKTPSEWELRVTRNARGVLISFAEDVFFEPCSDRIRAAAREDLDKLAEILNGGLIAKNDIEIWGHADSDPIIPIGECMERFQDNLGLASARANEIYRYFSSEAPSRVRAERMAATTFGDTRPRDENSTPERKAANRRIEVLIEHMPPNLP